MSFVAYCLLYRIECFQRNVRYSSLLFVVCCLLFILFVLICYCVFLCVVYCCMLFIVAYVVVRCLLSVGDSCSSSVASCLLLCVVVVD